MPIIKVEMLKGRSVEQKRELAEAMTREYLRICGGRPEAIYVVIDDVEKENWAVGGRLLADQYPDTK
jgi:4-oxalocrotonate tautomerase